MPRGDDSGSLGAFLPVYDVIEFHEIIVPCSPSAAYQAMEQVRLSDSRIISALTRMRGLGAPRGTLLDGLRARFSVLKEEPGHELVLGIVGQFWRLRGNVCEIDAAAFVEFHQIGFAKSAWNIMFEEVEGHGTRISTETRVQCLDAASRMKFRVYWTFVAPFSGLIRKEMLRLIERRVTKERFS